MYDTIIIGAGPAGLTAAIYLVRKKIKIIVLTDKIGGQIMDGPLIENYPAIAKITGPEWVQKTQKQAGGLGVEIKSGVEVKRIEKMGNSFRVRTVNDQEFEARSVLICSGKSPRKLGVPGEAQFQGKGISQCVTCDGPLFTGKTVAVIGGGNSAISAALELERYAQKVYILNLGKDLVGEEVRIDALKKSPKVEIIGQAKTSAVLGDKFVKGLKYKYLPSGQEKEIACEGIIVEIGWMPSTGYLADFIELTSAKDIKIDNFNQTNVQGVFAAGDATEILQKQLVIACGEAAKAALNVWEYLSKLKT